VGKESVLSVLESRLTNPAFAKDGNLLADTLKRDTRRLVNVDRQGPGGRAARLAGSERNGSHAPGVDPRGPSPSP